MPARPTAAAAVSVRREQPDSQSSQSSGSAVSARPTSQLAGQTSQRFFWDLHRLKRPARIRMKPPFVERGGPMDRDSSFRDLHEKRGDIRHSQPMGYRHCEAVGILRFQGFGHDQRGLRLLARTAGWRRRLRGDDPPLPGTRAAPSVSRCLRISRKAREIAPKAQARRFLLPRRLGWPAARSRTTPAIRRAPSTSFHTR